MECSRKRSLPSRFPVWRDGRGTNYRFDTFRVTEADLSDPDIMVRFEALSLDGLIHYRDRVGDPAVRAYLNQLIAQRPQACTPGGVAAITRQAETARRASLPWVSDARTALDRLHSLWINHKSDLLSGVRTLEGEVVCAFNSNFNTTQRDDDYGVRQIRVMSRLRALDRVMQSALAYSCQPITDPECSGGNLDAVAYVRGGTPPIHFCKQFRDSNDSLADQATVRNPAGDAPWGAG